MEPAGHPVDASARKRGLPSMMLMAMATGVIAGLGAWGFRELIGLVHNVLFLGEFSFAYDANTHTPPSPWGVGVVLVPVVGAVAVAWLVKNSRRKQRGMASPRSWMPSTTTRDASARRSRW